MRRMLIASVAAAVLALVAFWVFAPHGDDSPDSVERKTRAAGKSAETTKVKATRVVSKKETKPAAEKPKARYRRRHARGMSFADRTDLSAVEKRLLIALEKAVDDDDFKKLMQVLPEAAVSRNAEVRGDAVDALGWFGKDGMVELLPFMADPDEDVAAAARDAWTTSLSDIESEKVRGKYVASAMNVLTDKDSLRAMVMALDDCDELVVVQTLVDVIETGKNPKAVMVAKEHYEFVTDEQYTGIDAAEKWVGENSNAVLGNHGDSATDADVQ